MGTLMRCSLLLLICCLAGGFGGCSKSDSPTAAAEDQSSPTAAKSTAKPVAPSPPLDACTLLTSEEIQAVQGEPLQDAKASQNASGGMAMYDCYYTLPTFINSISLSVTQSGSGSDARDPAQSWEETFGEAARQRAKKSGPPQKIEGVGDEAFWAGDERMGALYVLKGSRFLRISVGGPGGQAAKIDKCRSLAEAALKKL